MASRIQVLSCWALLCTELVVYQGSLGWRSRYDACCCRCAASPSLIGVWWLASAADDRTPAPAPSSRPWSTGFSTSDGLLLDTRLSVLRVLIGIGHRLHRRRAGRVRAGVVPARPRHVQPDGQLLPGAAAAGADPAGDHLPRHRRVGPHLPARLRRVLLLGHRHLRERRGDRRRLHPRGPGARCHRARAVPPGRRTPDRAADLRRRAGGPRRLLGDAGRGRAGRRPARHRRDDGQGHRTSSAWRTSSRGSS